MRKEHERKPIEKNTLVQIELSGKTGSPAPTQRHHLKIHIKNTTLLLWASTALIAFLEKDTGSTAKSGKLLDALCFFSHLLLLLDFLLD